MKKWILRLAGALVSAAVIIFVLAWMTLRASLPTLDGEISARGIAAAATIERDSAGIPTITASNRFDLAFATGFAHGQDRFFQIDLIRRQGAGELSELFGDVTVETDKRLRFHRFRDRAEARRARSPLDEVELLERYAAGVNAGLASLGAKPFEYFLLGVEPEPWVAEDSILIVYAMYMQLNDERANRDVRRGLAERVLPEEVFAWMYPQGTSWDAPLMGEPRPVAPLPGPEIITLRDVNDEAPPAEEVGKPTLNGSNNWAVAGALTTSGRAIVSNDMHLGLSTPNIYYQARLVVDGGDAAEVIGVTMPGTPFVVAGSNTNIGWGYTNSYGDWSDAVLLRPGSAAGTYLAPQGELPFDEHREQIRVKGGDPIEFVIRETIWGPVDENANYPDGEIAVSWIAHFEQSTNLNILQLEKAQSVDEALDIANTMGMPPQNFMVGDAAGNIGWTLTGAIPTRSEFNPLLPADWSVQDGWTGWADAADYPRIVNPESGRLWSANARVADGDALRLVGDSGYDLGARAGQIRDGLFAKDEFQPEDMLAIQVDDRALFLARWHDLLLTVLSDDVVAGDTALAEYHDLVSDWTPRAVPESVGYRLVRAFRLEVQSRVFYALMHDVTDSYGDDIRLRISNQFEAPLWSLVSEQPIHLLPADYSTWQEFLLEAVRENIRYFEDNFDGGLSERTWGERNTAKIQHSLSRAIPWLSDFLDMPNEPLAGDVDMPRAQGPTFGASERFSVMPGDEANSLMHMPAGQSGHPLSDFYREGHDDWVNGKPSPFLPGETQHKLLLIPAE